MSEASELIQRVRQIVLEDMGSAGFTDLAIQGMGEVLDSAEVFEWASGIYGLHIQERLIPYNGDHEPNAREWLAAAPVQPDTFEEATGATMFEALHELRERLRR